MKKQFVSKIIFSFALLSNLSIMTSTKADQDWLNSAEGVDWTGTLPRTERMKYRAFAATDGTSLPTGPITVGPKASSSSSSGGGGGGGADTTAADAAQAAADAQAAAKAKAEADAKAAALAGGGGGAGGFVTTQNPKMAECQTMMAQIKVTYPDIMTDVPGFTAALNNNTAFTPTAATRRSYNLGTLGKKATPKKPMTAAETARHTGLVARKGKQHNPVMRAKKAAPARGKKAAPARGKKADAKQPHGKNKTSKTGNVKAQAVNKVS